MKKLLFCFVIVLIVCSIKVSAKGILVTLPNTIDSSYISDSDLIHSSNVDWNKEGLYNIDYFDKQDMSFNSKEVLVTNFDKLDEGVDILKEKELKLSSNIEVNKIINISNKEYFVLGSIDNNQDLYPTDGNKVFGYLAYYENDAMQWDRVFYDNRYGTITDGVVTEVGIAVYGDIDSPTKERNIFINVISFNNKLIYEKELIGSKNDLAKDIYYSDGLLIFTGVTESKDGDFPAFTSTNYDIFIGNIRVSTGVVNIYVYGNNGNDNLLSTSFYNGYLYLYTYLRGDGYYYNNSGDKEEFKCILEIDDRFDLNNWRAVEELNNELNDKIYVSNSGIVLYNFKYGTNQLDFYIYDLRLDFLEKQYLNLKDIETIKDSMLIIKNNNLYLSTVSRSNLGREVHSIIVLDSDYRIMSSYSREWNISNYKILNIDFNNSIFSVDTFDRFTGKVSKSDYYNIKAKNNLVDNSVLEYDDKIFYINHVQVSKRKVTSNVPSNPFGKYVDLYSLKLGEVEVLIPLEFYYKVDCNLRNKEVYDEDVVLRFNGKGILNDEEISSNYRITTSGKYVLELIGSNDERKIINFTVNKLSHSPSVLDKEMNREIEIVNNDSYININNEVGVYNQVEASVDNLAIVIVFGISSLGIVIGLVLPFHFWRRKDA